MYLRSRIKHLINLDMNYLDIFISIVILFGSTRGFLRGLFVEIAGLLSLIIGIYGAVHFSYFVADFLQKQVVWGEKITALVAFGITFVLIVIVISLLGKALTKVANFIALGWLNKILGAIFGAAKMILILNIVLNYFIKFNNSLNLVEQEKLDKSILLEPMQQVSNFLLPTLKELNLNSNGAINKMI